MVSPICCRRPGRWLFQGTSKQLGSKAVSDLAHDMSIEFVKDGISKKQFQV